MTTKNALKLIEAQRELIEFYEKHLASQQAFLSVHDIMPKRADIEKGAELRQRIHEASK
jgi:uncharacterized protein YqgQ